MRDVLNKQSNMYIVYYMYTHLYTNNQIIKYVYYIYTHMYVLGEHKPGRIKRAALPLQNQKCYMFVLLIRPRLYASECIDTWHACV